MELDGEDTAPPLPQYNEQLRAEISTVVSIGAPKAKVHRSECNKVMAGEPVEINPSSGAGYKVMTVKEYTSRWKRCAAPREAGAKTFDMTDESHRTHVSHRNNDFPDCLSCGSLNTKEHHFIQSWCRGAKRWESEAFCCDCHAWSWRSYW